MDENGEMTIDLIDKAEGEKTSSSNSNARKAVEQEVPGDEDDEGGGGDKGASPGDKNLGGSTGNQVSTGSCSERE